MNPGRRSTAGAVGLVLVGALTLQSGSALAVRLFARCGPGDTVFLRLVLAMGLLVALWRPRRAAFGPQQLRAALVLGAVLAAMNTCFYESIARIPLGVAVTIELAGPLTVAALGARRAADIAWVVLAAGGILLLAPFTGGPHLNPTGVTFAALAAACWALYIPANAAAGRAFSDGPGLGSGLAVTMLVSSLFVAPFAIPAGGPRLESWPTLGLGLVVALLCSVVPYTLELHALRTLPSRTFGVLVSLDPVFATISAFVVLHQRLRPVDLVAMGLVITASAGATLTARTPSPAAPMPD